MKTIGLIGGMSWESSIEYYRIIINEATKAKLGGLHSAKIEAAKDLENGGADFIVLCLTQPASMRKQQSNMHCSNYYLSTYKEAA